MLPNQSLVISETFYSIQGEGISVGTPAVFLRLAACNLNCLGFSYQDPNTKEHLGCDTKAVWSKGKKTGFDELLAHWEEAGFLVAFREQGAHLVITGGEPLLQQEKVSAFLAILENRLGTLPFIELETNATLLPNKQLFEFVEQINASPKLMFSKEPENKAYHLSVLSSLAQNPKTHFKFVVRGKVDVEEVIERYQVPLSLDAKRISLMAEGATRAVLQKREPEIVKLCKQFGFRFSPRLHIHLWDEATGV